MKRLALGVLLAASTALPSAAFDINAMTDEERAAFGDAVRDYLLENPRVLVEAIEVLESRQAEEQAAADERLVEDYADLIFNDEHSYVGGNPDGDVTIVEFLDYKCGYCRRAHPDVAELLTSDGNIRWVVKEFPILGEESLLASRFAIAVKEVEGDEAYGKIHDELMLMREEMTEDSLRTLSEDLGYDTAAIFEVMDTERVMAVIAENRQLAQVLNINGTPSFLFGKELIRGYVPLEAMRGIVENQRSDG